MKSSLLAIKASPSLAMLAFFSVINITAFVAAGYWWYFDTTPSQIIYQHPLFTSKPVDNKEDAVRYEITHAKSGSMVYRYQEYCMREVTQGVVERQWEDGVIYPIPNKRNIGQKGCFSKSFAEKTPPVTIETDLLFAMRIAYPNLNPVRTLYTEYNPIPLVVYPASAELQQRGIQGQ